MACKMKFVFTLLLIAFIYPAFAQHDSVVYRLYKDRDQLEYRLNKMVINQKLSPPLSDSTESGWQSAFFALQYLNRTDPWSKSRLAYAVTVMDKRSFEFQRGLLEVLYNLYPDDFKPEVENLLDTVTNRKVWSMAIEYLLQNASDAEKKRLQQLWRTALERFPDDPWLNGMRFSFEESPVSTLALAEFFRKDFLAGQVLMISIQRTNRDYPGIVVVRNGNGAFMRNPDGSLFAVPQLARSLSGLPGYLTNGNTPQGLLRMDGFDVSYAGAIGPTRNVQLSLPFEWSSHHFMRDSSLTDTVIRKQDYARLLPETIRGYEPMYEAFYAGKAGRHEIIAHGTTVKPEYYKQKPWYPFTPTLGCLCTNEAWDDETKLRINSDQEKLVQAITAAGGPYGYAIILNIDDQHAPVTEEEVLQLMRLAGNE